MFTAGNTVVMIFGTNCSHGVSEKMIAEKIIDILIKENFINEERLCNRLLSRDKFKYNKWGKIKIAAHLKSKNIPADIIKTCT